MGCSSIDTSKCYKAVKYQADKIRFEKKSESEDISWTTTTPLLVDIQGDCGAEVFGSREHGSIQIYDAKSGRIIRDFDTPGFHPEPANLAFGDVDLDNRLELIMATRGRHVDPQRMQGRIVCYELDGTIEWVSDTFHENPIHGDRINGNIGLADFNQDGLTELYIHNRIFNAQSGKLLIDGGENGRGKNHRRSVTVAANLDDDLTDLELAAGYTVYKVNLTNLNGTTGNSMTPMNIEVDGEFRDGCTAIGDIDQDGILDVIVHSEDEIGEPYLYVYGIKNGTASLMAQVAPPLNPYSYIYDATPTSTPAIGTIIESRALSILITREHQILAYEYDGSNLLKQQWSFSVIDESASVGMSLFDLNGDGVMEIIYRDEEYLRLIRELNNNPVQIDSIQCLSGTHDENPIVADCLGEGEANICVTCGDDVRSSTGKITIFGSPDTLQPWAPARNVWNQYGYHVYNINDNLTVPRVMKNNATEEGGRYNGFMVQQSLLDTNGFYKKRAASLHGLIKCVNYDIHLAEYEIIFDLYNRSDASLTALAGFPVGFFDGDPQSGGSLLGVYTTTTDLPAGDSLTNLSFTISGVNFSQLFMMVNSDETTFTNLDEEEFFHLECDYTDNLSSIFEIPEVRLLEDSICAGESYTFLDTTVMDDGIYFRELKDQQGCDSVCARLELKTIDSVHVVTMVMECDSFRWKGDVITESGTYSDQFVGNNGCDSTITVELTITKSTEKDLVVSTCEYYLIQGDSLTESGTYTFPLTNAEGCDSTLILDLTIHHAGQDTISRSVCQPYNWKGSTYTRSGMYRFDTLTEAGCDSTVTLALDIKDTITTSETINICEGDSVLVFGVYVDASQELTRNFSTTQGCDSVHTVDVIVEDVYREAREVSFCEGDSVFVVDRWIDVAGEYEITRVNANDCDSVLQITAIEKSTQATYDTLDLCDGDSLMIFGQSITTQGDIDQTYTGQNGCDSMAFVHVSLLDVSITQMSFTLCPQDSIFLNGEWIREETMVTETLPGDNGCDSLINYDITQIPTPDPPTAELNCEDGTVEVRITAQSNWHIEWDNGDTTRSTVYQNADEATVRLTTMPDCELAYTIDLPEVPAIGNISFPQDTVIAKGTSLVVNLGLDPTDWSVLWSPNEIVDCDTCMQVTITPDQTTRITLLLTHVSGCTLEAAFTIELDEERIFVPNVFSPNGDNLNDGFQAFFTDNVSILSVEIYDRWGELIYRSQGDDDFSWDGTFRGEPAPQAVYTYKIEYRSAGGKTQVMAGDVTLVR